MKVLFNSKSIVGRVLIVSLLVGGLVFAGTIAVNMFVPTPTEASNCCGSGEQGAASDSISSESKECCAKEDSIITASSSCSCGYSNCPDACTCGNNSKNCGCSPPSGQSCSCPTICERGSYSCDVGPGSCYSGS